MALSEEELLSRIKTELVDSLGYSGEISEQRAQAIDYYYARPFGNEVEGRSQFVDSTVQDTIEWIKPSLMRIFASGDEMVKFSPHGPEDVAAADQATDYVNYVFTKDNPGWEILYSWFHDALLEKNGIVKVFWEDYGEPQREEYHNLSSIELEALLQDESTEVVEHTLYDENDMNDVVIIRTNVGGRIRVENVPPDEFLISRESKTIEEARFVCHRVKKTFSDLKVMYPDKDFGFEDLSSGSDEIMYDPERIARHSVDRSGNYSSGYMNPSDHDDALREYWLHESYIKTDYDGDGIAELRKVCSIGSYVFSNEEIDSKPFISITPIKIPHKFFGLGVADLVMDLQLIKSTIMRNLMDNMYNQNFGRYAVLEGQANLDDLLTQRPGGVVRVKSPNAVMPLATPALEPYSFQMLEYMDSIRESRAGVSKNSQGLNDKALTSHTTATAVNAVMTNAQSRIELIARQFAETGVKNLMRRIYELLLKFQDKERVVMLRNEWVAVRPDMWNDKMDCTVSVALGNGSKDQQMAHLSQMIQFASQSMSGGLPIVTEQNMYNLGVSLVKAMGYQNVDDFLTKPTGEERPPSPEEQSRQMEQQIKFKELEIKQGELQVKMMKVQNEATEAQVDAQLKVAELKLEADQKRPVAIGDT
tara:strand:+ start:53 stop:1990 length:1938 start_codon:yes stop_codon:yes gene_type:complete